MDTLCQSKPVTKTEIFKSIITNDSKAAMSKPPCNCKRCIAKRLMDKDTCKCPVCLKKKIITHSCSEFLDCLRTPGQRCNYEIACKNCKQYWDDLDEKKDHLLKVFENKRREIEGKAMNYTPFIDRKSVV